MLDKISENLNGLNLKSYVLAILRPFSALVYNRLLKPYGGVGRHTQESVEKGLKMVTLLS